MSELIVMRHGQASFLSGDYDRLSELGVAQSRLLGAYWAGQGLLPTRLVVGPRRRHRQSAEAITAALAAAGVPCAEVSHDDRLDEFDWDGLLRYANATLSARDERVQALKEAFDAAADVAEKRRSIQHYMEVVTVAWANETFFEEGVESWREFCSRVETAVQAHTEEASNGSRVVLVTSGGVAAVTAGRALGLTPEKTVGLIWTLRNGALVEYLFSGGRFSLSSFNSAPHLPDRGHWTYR